MSLEWNRWHMRRRCSMSGRRTCRLLGCQSRKPSKMLRPSATTSSRSRRSWSEPMTDELIFKPVAELATLLETGKITSEGLARAFIARTQAVDRRVKAFNSRDEANALALARASDERRALGQARGPLDGIPVGFKDVIAVDGQPLTCSSKMLANFVSPYDATVTTNLKAAGAIPFGRLNMD